MNAARPLPAGFSTSRRSKTVTAGAPGQTVQRRKAQDEPRLLSASGARPVSHSPAAVSRTTVPGQGASWHSSAAEAPSVPAAARPAGVQRSSTAVPDVRGLPWASRPQDEGFVSSARSRTMVQGRQGVQQFSRATQSAQSGDAAQAPPARATPAAAAPAAPSRTTRAVPTSLPRRAETYRPPVPAYEPQTVLHVVTHLGAGTAYGAHDRPAAPRYAEAVQQPADMRPTTPPMRTVMGPQAATLPGRMDPQPPPYAAATERGQDMLREAAPLWREAEAPRPMPEALPPVTASLSLWPLGLRRACTKVVRAVTILVARTTSALRETFLALWRFLER